MSEYFHPKLLTVKAQPDWRLRTTWSTGEVLEVDVEKILRKTAVLRPLLDQTVFAQARLAPLGLGVEWFDTELAADNLYALGQEQAGKVSHQLFDGWMQRNDLSLTTAAAALGISRRMTSYYRTAQKPIPRAIWLACLGWEATRPAADVLPRSLPGVRRRAAGNH